MCTNFTLHVCCKDCVSYCAQLYFETHVIHKKNLFYSIAFGLIFYENM